jgi:hypothetical protein
MLWIPASEMISDLPLATVLNAAALEAYVAGYAFQP